MTSILRIDASARKDGSASRTLTDQLTARLDGDVTTRDLADTPMPHLTEDWVSGTFTPPPEARSDAQKEALTYSDELVAELQAADLLVISTPPVYNFGVPSSLKAWLIRWPAWASHSATPRTGPKAC